MAAKQTRRSVSISRERYAALQRLATARGQSMAAIVDQLIFDAAKAKPDTLASVPKGGGPVDAFAARLADLLVELSNRCGDTPRDRLVYQIAQAVRQAVQS